MSRSHRNLTLEYVAQLHRAVHAIGFFIDRRFGPDLTQPEAMILLLLAEHGSSSINEVHGAFLHRRSTLTSVLDRLEKKSFVSREIDPGDRRSIRISLTRSGRRLAGDLVRGFEDVTAELPRKVDEKTIELLGSTAAVFSEH